MVVKDLDDVVRCSLPYCALCSPADATRYAGLYWHAGILDRFDPEDVTWRGPGEWPRRPWHKKEGRSKDYFGWVSAEATCPCCRVNMDITILNGWDGWKTSLRCFHKRPCHPLDILEAIGLRKQHLLPWGWAEYWDLGAGPLPESHLLMLASSGR
jgi:hypothetical protein